MLLAFYETFTFSSICHLSVKRALARRKPIAHHLIKHVLIKPNQIEIISIYTVKQEAAIAETMLKAD